ncbi:type I-C CRISPR-associated protein Cas5c [Lacticaseibacillus zhaodongensis]|uniref:type I-C CRISPR-associated protein Cas5c n=1 Tax=Lacticaseibacillus zhaodongensis TaxID=2668065 RepID=UPI0012D32D36|nr:type I-C CRISPR-associated protein Cas5c [Lacticaseibacillus zhaodongensis]
MYNNNFEFEVYGRNALFCDPLFRSEKSSYSVPTYQALVGVVSSVYWKPTLVWKIDRVRVLHPFVTEAKGMRPLDKNFAVNKNSLAYYQYLVNPAYQIACHFEWNMQRDDLEADRNVKKHVSIFQRSLKVGGRRDIFLGTRECQAYVRPAGFGEGTSVFDNTGTIDLGQMFLAYHYPDEHADNKLSAKFWDAKMTDGIISFPDPDDCQTEQKIRDVALQPYDKPKLTQPVDQLYSETDGDES